MSFLTASTKEQYGLRLAISLAKSFNNKKPISLGQVAAAEQISNKYLEELVIFLKKNNYVKSVSGRSGGYIFLKDPTKVSVKDIIWLFTDAPTVVRCTNKKSICPLIHKCSAKNVWYKVQAQVELTLADIKISDLLNN